MSPPSGVEIQKGFKVTCNVASGGMANGYIRARGRERGKGWQVLSGAPADYKLSTVPLIR